MGDVYKTALDGENWEHALNKCLVVAEQQKRKSSKSLFKGLQKNYNKSYY